MFLRSVKKEHMNHVIPLIKVSNLKHMLIYILLTKSSINKCSLIIPKYFDRLMVIGHSNQGKRS